MERVECMRGCWSEVGDADIPRAPTSESGQPHLVKRHGAKPLHTLNILNPASSNRFCEFTTFPELQGGLADAHQLSRSLE